MQQLFLLLSLLLSADLAYSTNPYLKENDCSCKVTFDNSKVDPLPAKYALYQEFGEENCTGPVIKQFCKIATQYPDGLGEKDDCQNVSTLLGNGASSLQILYAGPLWAKTGLPTIALFFCNYADCSMCDGVYYPAPVDVLGFYSPAPSSYHAKDITLFSAGVCQNVNGSSFMMYVVNSTQSVGYCPDIGVSTPSPPSHVPPPVSSSSSTSLSSSVTVPSSNSISPISSPSHIVSTPSSPPPHSPSSSSSEKAPSVDDAAISSLTSVSFGTIFFILTILYKCF